MNIENIEFLNNYEDDNIRDVGGIKSIVLNGEDNLYPNKLEHVIRNSSSANSSLLVAESYLYGNGLILDGKEVKEVWNVGKKVSANGILKLIIRSALRHYGAFLYINYRLTKDGVLEPYISDVFNYSKCRVQRPDDNDYKGLMYYTDWENVNNFVSKKNKKVEFFYPYNENQEIIKAQIENDAENSRISDKPFLDKLKNYRGQYFFINDSPYNYPYSPFHSVITNMQCEALIDKYNFVNIKGGNHKSKIYVCKGMETKAFESFKSSLKKQKGVENSNLSIAINLTADKKEGGGGEQQGLANTFEDKPIDILPNDSSFDPKFFSNLKLNIRDSIVASCFNAPVSLIFPSEQIFRSGVAFKELKTNFIKLLSPLKDSIEGAIRLIMKKEYVIDNILDEKDGYTSKKKEAQITLRSDVNSINKIIEVQGAVKDGVMTKSSAMELIKELMGIENDVLERIFSKKVI
jgi:hypothetical protein